MFKCPFDWSKQPRTGRTRTFWVFEISVSGGGHAPGGGHGPDGVETRLVVGVDVLDGVLPEVFGKVDLWRVHHMFSRILNLRNLNKFHEICRLQVNDYEIVIKFFHISHNLTWYPEIVHKFTRISTVYSTHELTKQFMEIVVNNCAINLKKNNLYHWKSCWLAIASETPTPQSFIKI